MKQFRIRYPEFKSRLSRQFYLLIINVVTEPLDLSVTGQELGLMTCGQTEAFWWRTVSGSYGND